MGAPPKLILVSGFLGAGKTTLILRAARLLQSQGLSVAVITNDQDDGLVDTRFSESSQLPTGEVAGGCFCCRFSDLMNAAAKLKQYEPDVIFAEPVGSCVDLSATILQPLKAYFSREYAVAPLTVLVDPEMARRVFAGEASEDVAYLFRHQLTEADILCATKMDLNADAPALPMPVDYQLSAVTGHGIEAWLNDVRHGGRVVGARLLDVDYGRYAEAEAALGWVNIQADLALRRALSPARLVGPVMDEIESDLTEAGIAIAHLKAFDRCREGYVKVSVCRNGDDPRPEGDLTASPDTRHEIVINLRAAGAPEQLRDVVMRALQRADGEITIRHTGAFRPSPPKPEHRFAKTAD